MVKRVVVRGELEEGTEDALKQTMEMVAYQALKVAAYAVPA